jgi:uridine kinase
MSVVDVHARSPRSQLWGICGGSGSGKSTLVRMLLAAAPPRAISVLHVDAYYRDLSHLSAAARADMNFDAPDSLESELLLAHVRALLGGEPVGMPRYDFANHARLPGTDPVEPAPVVLIEGILLFAFPALLPMFDYRVFIDVPEDVRLERRVARDVVTRGRSEESVRAQFARTVAPMHWRYVQPGMGQADRVVRYGEEYGDVALDLAARARDAARHWGAHTR